MRLRFFKHQLDLVTVMSRDGYAFDLLLFWHVDNFLACLYHFQNLAYDIEVEDCCIFAYEGETSRSKTPRHCLGGRKLFGRNEWNGREFRRF